MVPFSISVVVGIVCELVLSAPVAYYASKYDHIDVEMILNNRRMVNYYGACLLSTGPCPPDGLEFKRILPEALRTNCLRCTEKQKTVTLRTIRRLKKEYPKVWAQLQQQWDPDDFYVRRFEKTFSNRQAEPDVQTETKSIPDMKLETSSVDIPSVKPEASVQLFNRFGDDDDDANTISSVYPSETSVSTSSSTSSTTRAAFTTTKQPAIERISTTTEAIKKITRITTIAPIITKSTTKITPIRPIAFRPIANFGAGIEATVSLGTNIVGELVRGLGALGNRVVETGAEIAGVVIKNIARPL